MKKFVPLLTVLFQVFIAFIVLFIVYIIYALADNNEADMVNSVGFLIFQPFFGLILTSITIAVCLFIGLPIRLIRRVKQWWYTKPAIPLMATTIGLLLLALAFYPAWTETVEVNIDGEPSYKYVPNSYLSITGWFMTAFSILHFYPQSILRLLKRKKIV